MKPRQLAVPLVVIGIVSACGSADGSTSTSTATTSLTSQPASTEAPSTSPAPQPASTEAPSTSPATSAAEEQLVTESANPDGGVTCTVEGLAFTSPFASCDMAIAIGTPIVVELGLANESPGIEMIIASTCYAIQGQEEKTGQPATIELANRLNAEDVCPGNPDLIVP